MSAYTTRLCLEHGEWDDDVDNPSDCPDCIKEGKTEVQRLNAEIAALRERVKALEGIIASTIQHSWSQEDFDKFWLAVGKEKP